MSDLTEKLKADLRREQARRQEAESALQVAQNTAKQATGLRQKVKGYEGIIQGLNDRIRADEREIEQLKAERDELKKEKVDMLPLNRKIEKQAAEIKRLRLAQDDNKGDEFERIKQDLRKEQERRQAAEKASVDADALKKQVEVLKVELSGSKVDAEQVEKLKNKLNNRNNEIVELKQIIARQAMQPCRKECVQYIAEIGRLKEALQYYKRLRGV